MSHSYSDSHLPTSNFGHKRVYIEFLQNRAWPVGGAITFSREILWAGRKLAASSWGQVDLLWGITQETVKIWILGHQNLRGSNSEGLQGPCDGDRVGHRLCLRSLPSESFPYTWSGPWETRHQLGTVLKETGPVTYVSSQDQMLSQRPVLGFRFLEIGATCSLLIKPEHWYFGL